MTSKSVDYGPKSFFSKLFGGLFIVAGGMIGLFIVCPSNVQYFIIYSLMGIGLALLFAKSAEQSKTHFTVHNVTVTLVGAIALPFSLYFTNPIGSFKPDSCQLRLSHVGISVYVHGKESKQSLILRQQGYVLMDVNGERRKEPINEKGLAFFPNLSEGDKIRLDIDFSEPYKSIHPDSVYTIHRDSNIYLAVALKGIGELHGMVLYDDQPLTGVTVKLIAAKGVLMDTTDQTGGFSFNIPESIQQKEYQVWFIKKGFQIRSAPAFPETGQSLNIVLIKHR